MTTADSHVYHYITQISLDSGKLTSAYFGNPNGGEPYAFLNFFATDNASKITSLHLYGTGFEADSCTVAAELQSITGTYVPAPGAMWLIGGAFSV